MPGNSTSLSPTDESWPTSNDNDNDQYKDNEYARITNEIPPNLSLWTARQSGDRRYRTKSVHDLLVKWAKFAKRQSEMHDMSWAYFKKWNLTSAIVSTIIVSASGLVTIGLGQRTSSCNGESSSPSIPIIIAGAMSLVGSTIMGINKLLAYGEIQQQHDIYSDSYEIMYNDIALNMTLGKSSHRMFNNDSEFIKYLKYKMDQLIDRAPPITNHIREKYDKKYPQPKRWRRSREQNALVTKTNTHLQMQEAITAAVIDANTLSPTPTPPLLYASADDTTQDGIDRHQRHRASISRMNMRSMDGTERSSMTGNSKRQPARVKQTTADISNIEPPPLARSVYTNQSASGSTISMKTMSGAVATGAGAAAAPYLNSFIYAPPVLPTPAANASGTTHWRTSPLHTVRHPDIQEVPNEIQADIDNDNNDDDDDDGDNVDDEDGEDGDGNDDQPEPDRVHPTFNVQMYRSRHSMEIPSSSHLHPHSMQGRPRPRPEFASS
jgi:hypothetical protein